MKTILVDGAHTFLIEIDGIFGKFEEMHDLLKSFPNKKIIVTNATKENEFEKYGLNKVSCDVFTLEHKPNKTDPKYFEVLLERFGLEKDDVVYFEHSPEAVESARSVGINTYHYDSEKRDLVALKKFLVENL